jgi:CRP/FNR family transcriptional regulator, cyclic AMP receptor protein
MDRSRVAPLFLEGVPDEELDAVARIATEREFSDGEPLMTEGDFGHSLFLVEEGTADVIADEAKVGDVGPGDVVGEVAVLASGRRIASVVATSPVRAIALFKRDVWALENEAPEASRRLRAAIDDHLPADADASSE